MIGSNPLLEDQELAQDETDTENTKIAIEHHSEYGYHLNETNMYLAHIFGSSSLRKIIAFLDDGRSQTFTILTILTWFALRICADFVMKDNDRVYFVYAIYLTVVCLSIWIPLEIIWILRCNKTAFRLIIRSFEFWLKLSAAVFFAVLNYIYMLSTHREQLLWVIAVSYFLFNLLTVPLMIVCISTLDGQNVSKLWKMLFCGVTGSVLLFFSIKYEFLVSQQEDVMFTVPVIHRTLSLCSQMASAERILSIFLFKQLFLTWYYKDQCVLITYTPHLVWDENKFESDEQVLYSFDVAAVQRNKNTQQQLQIN